MKNIPSSQERVWAVIAHLSALAMGMGLLLPVLGWSESRRRSNYASFQCLQALGYQSLGYTIWILITLMVVVVVSVGSVAGILNAQNMEKELITFTVAHTVLMFGLIGAYFALPVIGAIACALGKDFRYPWMGNRLAKYLGYAPAPSSDEQVFLIEEYEDRWVTAMGHFTVIIMLWGLLAPVTAWILQGKRSLFLRFQSVQAVAFQAATLFLYFGAGILYFGGALIFIFSMGFSGAPDLSSPTAFAGMGIFLISMLCLIGIILIVPLLHIMGQWAGYRILKGDDYHYPLVGKWVTKWMDRKSTEENNA